MRDHYDALDFDLFDRWRVRLRDVPLSIGWGAVALFLRHMPRDSETIKSINPAAAWSREEHLLASIADLIGDLFAKEYEHIERPGAPQKPYATAEPVNPEDYNSRLAKFGGGDASG